MDTAKLYQLLKLLNDCNVDCSYDSFRTDNILFIEEARQFFSSLSLNLHDIYFLNCGIIRIINPLELPIKLVKTQNQFYGQTRFIMTQDEPVFNSIILGDNLSHMSSCIYVHELIHTQTAYDVRSMDKQEIISVFMDKLASLNKNQKTFVINQHYRFNMLKDAIYLILFKNLSIEQLKKIKIIIETILESEHLFNKYINGSNNDKISILNNIQSVFDRKIDILDFLDIIGINLYNSLKETYILDNLKLGEKKLF